MTTITIFISDEQGRSFSVINEPREGSSRSDKEILIHVSGDVTWL